jgi:hypothetical protein
MAGFPRGTVLYEEDHGLGSFSAVAAFLTERYVLRPPVKRQHVYGWWVRGTLNKAGQKFPQPVRTEKRGPKTLRYFALGDVSIWYAAGVKMGRRAHQQPE